MSSSNPTDPRLLLPEWLRDGDTPSSATIEVETVPVEEVAALPPAAATSSVEASTPMVRPATVAIEPFSDRLSLDTRLDPGLLVSAADLPKWLGGLERIGPATVAQPVRTATGAAGGSPVGDIQEPEPYVGVDAPEDGVVDVEINGWVLVAAAVGLLILLAAAFKLYIS